MGAVNERGVWVPAVSDGLLAGWQAMASQLGVFIPVESVEAASAALDAAQSAGIGATTANPIMFVVGWTVRRVSYIADGTKTDGKWNLVALNEVQVADDTYETPWSGLKDFSVIAGAYTNMMASSLPAAPYDRLVVAEADAYGKRLTGTPRLRINVNGRIFYGTFDSDPATATARATTVIPANTAPSITVGLFGGGSVASSVQLSGEENQNSLIVTAFPISMKA